MMMDDRFFDKKDIGRPFTADVLFSMRVRKAKLCEAYLTPPP